MDSCLSVFFHSFIANSTWIPVCRYFFHSYIAKSTWIPVCRCFFFTLILTIRLTWISVFRYFLHSYCQFDLDISLSVFFHSYIANSKTESKKEKTELDIMLKKMYDEYKKHKEREREDEISIRRGVLFKTNDWIYNHKGAK